MSDDQKTVVTLSALVEGARERAAEQGEAQLRDAWLGLANAAERVQRAIAKRARPRPMPVH